MLPVLHTHCPASQTRPPVQATPQPPQLAESMFGSMHAPAQSSCPAEHPAAQAPLEQTRPVVHATLHIPQFLGSLFVSTQTPLQSAAPAGHAQMPRSQI
jgi:hypothetical protein